MRGDKSKRINTVKRMLSRFDHENPEAIPVRSEAVRDQEPIAAWPVIPQNRLRSVSLRSGVLTLRLIGGGSVTWLGPITPGSGSLANGACTLGGAASSASGSGTHLTVSFSIPFQPSYAGRRAIFPSARDNQGLTLNCSPGGVWRPAIAAGANQHNTLMSRGFTGEGAIGEVYDAPNGSVVACDRIYIIPAQTHFWTTDRSTWR
jgi:hypothetical protein